ncbi:MAG: hypothetical protein OXU45_03375, partial [Candidatus Melainabacteria bacterium]|nr:hypothetical protein [Candidatus Melainabacteria bacterium]
IEAGHYTLGSKTFSVEQLRDLANPAKPLRQAWQEAKQARRAYKQAHRTYWDDTFEREARDFAVANRFSPTRLLKDLGRSLYII